MRKRILFLLSALFSAHLLYGSKNVYFIRLNIDENKIELGKFETFPLKQVELSIPIGENADSALFISYMENARLRSPGSSLFFLHCMWGANNGFVRYQFPLFENDFLGDSSLQIGTIFYILWDTKPVGYFDNAENAAASGILLNKVFHWMEAIPIAERERNILYCHSMGNKVFFTALHGPEVKGPVFGRMILAAADIDEQEFYSSLQDGKLFQYCSRVVLLTNTYDYALRLSRAANAYYPLGLGPQMTCLKYTQITNH
ncbi:MAG: alpha/beta hydrolase [Chitinophagales bacterium]